MDADHKVAEVERILGYTFVNKLLCAEAIQMASPALAVTVNGQVHVVVANRHLAILGDTVAALVLCRPWFTHRDQNGIHQTPAAWTNIRQGRLSNGALAQLGHSLGLSTVVIVAPGHEGTPGTVMMATAVEAILGAIYLDGEEEAVRRVMDHVGLTQQLIRGVEAPGSPPERARKDPRASQSGLRVTSSA